MKIEDLKEHIGEEAELTVFLTDAKLTANKNNNRWIDLTVTDVTGTTTLKLWSDAMVENQDTTELIGYPVKVTGLVDLWQGVGGMNVMRIQQAEEGTYKMSDFFPALDEKDTIYLNNRLDILIGLVKDERLRSLLKTIFSESRRKKLVEKCGGTKHHTYFGGLPAHLIQTAELAKAAAEMLCVVGPYRTKVDTDLVIAGGLLHDIGKLTTLSDTPGQLTDRGFNVTSSTESVLYVTMYNNQLKERVSDLAPLDNIILACGDAKPRSLEAIIVRNADMMSSQVDACGLAFFDDTKAKGGGKYKYSSLIGALLLQKGDE